MLRWWAVCGCWMHGCGVSVSDAVAAARPLVSHGRPCPGPRWWRGDDHAGWRWEDGRRMVGETRMETGEDGGGGGRGGRRRAGSGHCNSRKVHADVGWKRGRRRGRHRLLHPTRTSGEHRGRHLTHQLVTSRTSTASDSQPSPASTHSSLRLHGGCAVSVSLGVGGVARFPFLVRVLADESLVDEVCDALSGRLEAHGAVALDVLQEGGLLYRVVCGEEGGEDVEAGGRVEQRVEAQQPVQLQTPLQLPALLVRRKRVQHLQRHIALLHRLEVRGVLRDLVDVLEHRLVQHGEQHTRGPQQPTRTAVDSTTRYHPNPAATTQRAGHGRRGREVRRRR